MKWYEYQTEAMMKSGRHHPIFNEAIRYIHDNVKGKKVLDVGCNAGLLSLTAARYGASEVLGLDIKGEAIARAIEIHNYWKDKDFVSSEADLEFQTGNIAECLSLIKNYDFFIFSRVLHHIRIGNEKLEDLYRYGITGIFNELAYVAKTKPITLLIQGNLGRESLINPDWGFYGNNLCNADGINRLLDAYKFKYININKELVIGTN